ncbi:multidrug effflux MFS transporter [Rikenella microfusus]|uniref:multidrug effflux MFS transporter n=1 Tax=Rikenella microfusus TaxID=28139 RepID=UPI001D284F72|nr:multidrug effflux MFS transporter [Rikenella microfusus]HJE88829.1 multidrug effflux MFS transporter [Rikenella microfusus]
MIRNSRIYTLLSIGTVSAMGPFVTDFYLPCLPALSDYFSTTASLVQLSLTFTMIGLAVGQLFIGPLSDRYGRKRPLVWSMALFCLATVGCLLSPDIRIFLLFRLVQGLSGAGGVVISRSIASDLYRGKELARFFSMLSIVQGLAPICAPVLGGLLLEYTDWRGIFAVLLAIGAMLTVILLRFRESLSPEARATGNIGKTFRGYVPVLRNRRFMLYVLVQAFAMGVMFSYIAASPFVFQQHFGLSPFAYSLCFGANALAIMGGSLLTARFRSASRALRAGAAGFLATGCLAAAAFVAGSVWSVEISLLALLFFLGLILPSSTTLALELERDRAGKASAVLGFLMFFAGGALSPLTGLGDMLHSTALILFVCSAAVYGTARLTRSGERTEEAAADR